MLANQSCLNALCPAPQPETGRSTRRPPHCRLHSAVLRLAPFPLVRSQLHRLEGELVRPDPHTRAPSLASLSRSLASLSRLALSQPIQPQREKHWAMVGALQGYEVLDVHQSVRGNQSAREECVVDAKATVAWAVARALRPIGELAGCRRVHVSKAIYK